ncbi:MAG: hypothetical protein BMS9Abin29_2282 [Gemmatimonadota bacterium]|nr:MAG: hypothetical protein BMS9Abin29_2282 [Gemmatimonadota bacterium]
MILAPLSDQLLRFAVYRAALPDEDVFCRDSDIADALALGYPRLAVVAARDEHPMRNAIVSSGVPVLVLGTLDAELARPAPGWTGVAVREIDTSVYRLRRLMADAAGPRSWVDGILVDLGRMCGFPLPREFRGFVRRLLDFPARYNKLEAIGAVAELSAGALKARFRRRGLASPFAYMSWLRVIAATRVLADPSITTVEAAFRLGYTSNGNFCRSIQTVSGLTTTDLRSPEGRNRVLAAFVTDYLTPEVRDSWESLSGLFRRVA